VSNGNAAAGVLLTAAILTGISHGHGTSVRRHVTGRHWVSPEHVELGDARIPVRSVRVRTPRSRFRPGGRDSLGGTRAAAAPREIIVGYVDPARGPAAFHRLAKVSEGDRVKVVRQDDSVAWFKVDSVRRAARDPLGPHRSVGELGRAVARERPVTGRPELRLISFRRAAHRSRAAGPGGVVVSAHLDRPARAPG
jgi:hypothetical protein